MKKILFTLTFIAFFPFTSFCQQLTLEQLISLYNKDVDDINDFLLGKGWVYNGIVEEPENDFSGIVWAFGYDGLSRGAEGWFLLKIEEDEIVSASYQGDQPFFDAIKKRAADIGMKKIDSGINDSGSLWSRYAGANYIIEFMVGKDRVYSVIVSRK